MEFDKEFDQLNLLTQYIGPGTTDNNTPLTPSRQQRENEQGRSRFLGAHQDLVDMLDRATGHKVALERALALERTPAKLKINIKPLVIQCDDPIFVAKQPRSVRPPYYRPLLTI